jgi:hypothetical protein
MCALSRFIVLATLVGVAASSLTGSDLVGWLAAGAAAALLWLAERLVPQLQGRSCPVPTSASTGSASEAAPISPLRIDRPGSGCGPAEPAGSGRDGRHQARSK